MDKNTKEGRKEGRSDMIKTEAKVEVHKNGMGRLFTTFIVGLVIGFFGGSWYFTDTVLFWTTKSSDKEKTNIVSNTPVGSSDNVSSSGITTGGGNSVSVNDQIAGDRVLLETITLQSSGWVVVHEDMEGSLGNALGARRFDPGTYADGYVELLRNTETDKLYYVVLYADDGDKEFNIKTDMQIKNTSGALILDTFHTILVDRKTN